MFVLGNIISYAKVILCFNKIGLAFFEDYFFYDAGKSIAQSCRISKRLLQALPVTAKPDDPYAICFGGNGEIAVAIVINKYGHLHAVCCQHSCCKKTIGADAATMQRGIFRCKQPVFQSLYFLILSLNSERKLRLPVNTFIM